MRPAARGLRQHTRRLDVEGVEPRTHRVGDVENLAVGRQATAVRAEERIGEANDLRAVGQRVIDAAMVAMTRIALAEIGEIEAALLVEHQIVGRAELVAVALDVESPRLAGLRVEPLDRPVLVVGMRPLSHRLALDVAAAAVVAEIKCAIGPDRQTVRPAAGRRKHRHRAVRGDARAAAIAYVGQDHRAVGHRNGPLGEAQAAGQNTHLVHCVPPTSLSCRLILQCPREEKR